MTEPFCGQLDFFMQGYCAALEDCLNKTSEAKDLPHLKEILTQTIHDKKRKIHKLEKFLDDNT